MRISFLLFFIFIGISNVFSNAELTAYSQSNHAWADSVLASMTLKEKIGQLIMVTSEPHAGEKNEEKISKWITDQKVGGVLFLKTTPYNLALRARRYQNVSKVPLFIALDAENGLSFRLDSVVRYPYAMGLGAVNNDSLLYQMGREVGQQCKMLGINLNFAPVADVNSNPDNPVINYRSFGENPQNVASKSWQLAKGMQDEHILVTAKHFPGHGDTGYDSHYTLPIIRKNYNELKTLEFVPFKKVIDSGINGIMSAHINLSNIDKRNLPATLSHKIMNDILRDSLGFDGLIFSDGMNMKGITKNYSEAEAAVAALKAGVDVIEFILDPAKVIKAVDKAVKKGTLSEELISEKCRKVLLAKSWTGLSHQAVSKLASLHDSLNQAQYRLTAQHLFEQSITVLQNHDSILPLKRLDTLKIAVVSIGDTTASIFENRIDDYLESDHYYIGLDASDETIQSVFDQLNEYNLVIAGVHKTRLSKGHNFGITEVHRKVIEDVLQRQNVILAFFGSPYALAGFDLLEKAKSILVTYGENEHSQDASAQLIFGAIGTESKLPVSINELYPEGTGVSFRSNGRLKYTIPEELGFDSKLLFSKIDSFARFGISDTIFPGCQILVAKDDRVIANLCFGYYTYDSLQKVTCSSIYDWASITKISGPLPWLMKLTEDSVINLDKPFVKYWPAFKHTDKNEITFREILAHQAGFKAWVPFNNGRTGMDSVRFRNRMLSSRPSRNYPVLVAPGLYANKRYKKTMFADIAAVEIDQRKKYYYSDIAFYLFPDVISRLIHKDYVHLVTTGFWAHLGTRSVHYNPYKYFAKDRLVPTEFDDVFRKQLVRGYVHDESAALLGGISGNAGLFGTANDLAKLMQLYLNGGSYGDFQFLKPSTISEFTRIQFPENENRRGLGFDKPYIDNAAKKLADAYPATAVSPKSFGHGGFTGTFVWDDPENQLIFVFLSNRVYPTRKSNKLVHLNFRPELQQAIYESQNSFQYQRY